MLALNTPAMELFKPAAGFLVVGLHNDSFKLGHQVLNYDGEKESDRKK